MAQFPLSGLSEAERARSFERFDLRRPGPGSTPASYHAAGAV
jgi:hypothetical protein